MASEGPCTAWKWRELYALLLPYSTGALLRADPDRLIEMSGAPDDEYDYEASEIAMLVVAKAESRDDVLQLAGDVFSRMLGARYEAELAGFADEVWSHLSDLLRQKARPQSPPREFEVELLRRRSKARSLRRRSQIYFLLRRLRSRTTGR
jgi:hypothetical protein